jgi:hypothetical protein
MCRLLCPTQVLLHGGAGWYNVLLLERAANGKNRQLTDQKVFHATYLSYLIC